MKLTFNILENRRRDADKRWPNYLLGGRIRTSTLVLIIAFFATWWTYNTYKPQPPPRVAPSIVPPGFVPDPGYTWVPRTRVRQPQPTYEAPTYTPTTTVPPPPPPTTTPTPPPLIPPFVLPPPFGPGTTTPAPPPGPLPEPPPPVFPPLPPPPVFPPLPPPPPPPGFPPGPGPS